MENEQNNQEAKIEKITKKDIAQMKKEEQENLDDAIVDKVMKKILTIK